MKQQIETSCFYQTYIGRRTLSRRQNKPGKSTGVFIIFARVFVGLYKQFKGPSQSEVGSIKESIKFGFFAKLICLHSDAAVNSSSDFLPDVIP